MHTRIRLEGKQWIWKKCKKITDVEGQENLMKTYWGRQINPSVLTAPAIKNF